MKLSRYVLLAVLPGLMCCLPFTREIDFRMAWQLYAIWLAGIVFMALLTSWWRRGFFALALVQVIFGQPILTSYITLLMIAIFLAAAEGYKSFDLEALDRRMDPEIIMDMMALAACLLTAWIVLQKAGVMPGFSLGANSAGPFNRISGSVFLALCLPAFFRKKLRFSNLQPPTSNLQPPTSGLQPPTSGLHQVQWWHLLPVPIAGLWLCASTTGIVAAVIGGIVWMLLAQPSRKIVILAGLAGLMIAALFFWRVDPLGETMRRDRPGSRWAAWRHIVMSYRSAPLGRGLGSFAQLFPIMAAADPAVARVHEQVLPDGTKVLTTPDGWWCQAHNEYLQAGFEMGLQAILFIGAYLVWLGRQIVQRSRHSANLSPIIGAGLAALAISCTGWHTFHVVPLALVGVAWVGMAEGMMISSKMRKKS